MELITDRTLEDVTLGTEKGVYGYSDLNRVEQAVQELSGYFSALGITGQLVTKTDWTPPEDFSTAAWPVASQMARYLENVRTIKELFPNSVILPESMEDLTWETANNIEKILQTASLRIGGIFESYHYSGEIFAGEEF